MFSTNIVDASFVATLRSTESHCASSVFGVEKRDCCRDPTSIADGGRHEKCHQATKVDYFPSLRCLMLKEFLASKGCSDMQVVQTCSSTIINTLVSLEFFHF